MADTSLDRFGCRHKRVNAHTTITSPVDLFQLAARERTVTKAVQAEDERTLLLVGSKNAGKTTAVLRFLDRTSDKAKATLALEYTYGRKSRTQDMGKDVVHIWELGGGTYLSKLIETPITHHTLRSLAVVLALDLSRPDELWHTAVTLLSLLRERIDKLLLELKSKDSKMPQYLKKKAAQKYGDDHPDKDMVTPLPVPLVILGTKYDVFQDLPSEHRKIISKTMRFLAHMNGAALYFVSDKDEALVSRCRIVLNQLAFKAGSPARNVAVDHNKPLAVPAGADSLAQIGAPPTIQEAKVAARRPEDLWAAAMQHYFPSDAAAASQVAAAPAQLPADPAAQAKFAEPAIDELRLQKEEELERYRRHAERKAKEQAAKLKASASSSAAEPATPGSSARPASGKALPATPTAASSASRPKKTAAAAAKS